MLKFPSGFTNCVLLNRLKISARNWKYFDSVSAIRFDTVISHWFSPGPQQMDRGVVANCPRVGSLNCADRVEITVSAVEMIAPRTLYRRCESNSSGSALAECSRHLRRTRPQEEQAADQLIVILRLDADRKAALQLDDPRELPVIQHFALQAAVLADGKIPNVVDDEALRWS